MSKLLSDGCFGVNLASKRDLGFSLLLLIKFWKYAALAVESARLYFCTYSCHWMQRASSFYLPLSGSTPLHVFLVMCGYSSRLAVNQLPSSLCMHSPYITFIQSGNLTEIKIYLMQERPNFTYLLNPNK